MQQTTIWIYVSSFFSGTICKKRLKQIKSIQGGQTHCYKFFNKKIWNSEIESKFINIHSLSLPNVWEYIVRSLSLIYFKANCDYSASITRWEWSVLSAFHLTQHFPTFIHKKYYKRLIDTISMISQSVTTKRHHSCDRGQRLGCGLCSRNLDLSPRHLLQIPTCLLSKVGTERSHFYSISTF